MSPSRLRRTARRQRRAAMRAVVVPWRSGPLAAAWEHAGWFYRLIRARHGAPLDIACAQVFWRRRHQQIADLVHHLEVLLRGLIFAAALALALPPAAASPGRAGPRRRRIVWPLRPESWPARFRMHRPGDPAGGGRRQAQPLRPSPTRARGPFRSAVPLARRFEACRRVLADPRAHIRRYAFALARRRAAGKPIAPPVLIRPPRLRDGFDSIADVFNALIRRVHERWLPQPQPG